MFRVHYVVALMNGFLVRRRVALAGFVIVVVVASVWGNGVADGSGPTKHARVSPALKAHFALFRRRPRSGFAALLSAAPREVRWTLMNYESGARPFFCRDCRLDVEETRVVQIGRTRLGLSQGLAARAS